ncbi:MAG TPA: HlyD family efflux transporter periplasmic adaptor subunit [Desulfobacterales bacterium]|nr:HlyD family efflux transporter periplasmic adaptor subunit [Desulfobacterales bacterium]
MNKNKRKVVVLGLLLIIIAGGGYYYYHQASRHRGPAGRLRLYGNVDIRQVAVAFYDSGRIQKIMVHEGDQVKAGQLLAQLNPARYQAALNRLQAELVIQRHEVAKLEHGSRPEEIKAARAQVKGLTARMDNAHLIYRRLRKMYARKSIARQKVDDAQAVYTSLQEEVRAARQKLDLAVKGPRAEDIAAAKAKLQAKKDAVSLARIQLKDTRVYAPVDGVIQDRIMEPGDMAFPNTPVLTLARTSPVWVRAYIPESSLGRIRLGMKAAISTDSFPGRSYRGWVGYISPTAEFTPKNVESPDLRTRLVYQARVFACNPQGELRLGMPATVTINLRQAPDNGMKDKCGE